MYYNVVSMLLYSMMNSNIICYNIDGVETPHLLACARRSGRPICAYIYIYMYIDMYIYIYVYV